MTSAIAIGVVALHVGAGALALVGGAVALASLKGGQAHRRAGRAVLGLGLVSCLTAIVGNLLTIPRPGLFAVTLSASYLLIGSWRSLALARTAPKAIDMATALVALACVGGIASVAGPGTASFSPAVTGSTLAFVTLVALYDLQRAFWSNETWRRARTLDHGLKMTGFYFAMMSAAGGNLIPSAQPWSSIAPSVVGTSAMIYFAVKRWPRAEHVSTTEVNFGARQGIVRPKRQN